ncbi:cyclic nucleotide-gated ion channel 17-like [Canna indica]|uniref:Cyclic nucleotide-gated ion channel 17-like n=1 Tax=Canna indica TaxID=4628 RepID=A0AAQ3KHF3_9LILI|nr:cyclic nucleotide-gated ion channel 17-like [Canna indica]
MHGSKISDEVELEKAVRFHIVEKQDQATTTHRIPKSINVLADRKNGRPLGKPKDFHEGHHTISGKKILDPGSPFVLIWNRVFLVSCLISLFIDPLIFYWPLIEVNTSSACINMDQHLRAIVTWLRSLVDLFYVLNIVVKFHTAYVAPSSRVFGKGELVMDGKMIGKRYVKSDLLVDLAAALPIPQIVILIVMPAIRRSSNITLTLVILIQYILRLYLIYPLSDQITKAAGVITKNAWGGAVYNLLLYLLASHIIGAIWYLLTVQRQATCWLSQCDTETNSGGISCHPKFLDCDFSRWTDREIWANTTHVFVNCDPNNPNVAFKYGIFENSLKFGGPSTEFIDKYFYGLWWGLQQLTSAGQNLTNSTFVGETLFATLISMISLILFAQLIGNMQTYLQSITAKVEEWRLKQTDTEEWMRHRQLPHHLRDRVKQFVQYKWLATRGVDEESILQGLPSDLRRDIKRHLCLYLVRRVPFFSKMDNQLLDAICERLVSSLCTEGTLVVREGDPVTSMLFIIRGKLESSTTNGGRNGFYNSTILSPGDFCGEELLSWALQHRSDHLPSSTMTVRALVEVEAFALCAEDLKFVANQFKRLHSKKLQHTFRYYSHQWRTWAACFIQAAWRRYKRRKRDKDLNSWGSISSRSDEEGSCSSSINAACSMRSNASTSAASNFAESSRSQRRKSLEMSRFQKPDEPDYSNDLYD